MPDDTQTQPATPAAAAPAPAPFQHQVSHKQYLEGLKAELESATTAKHKAAVQAEIDALAASPK